jgi:NRPS condensation-like uncharacterized protein
MLADDSANYPRLFFLVVQLKEALDEGRLTAAIDVATRRHPLLRANVEYNGDRPQRWIECREPTYLIEWRNAESGRERVVEPIDLRNEPGVRFAIERGADGDALAVEFHHASTDGIGALQFIGDLLTLYTNGGRSDGLPPLDPTRLATRDCFGLTGWRRVIRWLYGTVGWLGAIEFLLHRPAPLGRIDAVSSRASGFCSRTLTSAETTALLRNAKDEHATVNDLLLREMFLSMQSHLDLHWPDRSRSHLRIMVPTNLRAAEDAALPACNVVAMINIDRRVYRWTDHSKLLRVLHRELAAVKRFKLGVVFVQLLHVLQTLFGSLRRFLPADRCQASCVVSNLGVVLRETETEAIRSVEFYPPIRPLSAAAFGVATLNGELTLSLHYDAAALTAEEAAELLDGVTAQIRTSTGSISSGAVAAV